MPGDLRFEVPSSISLRPFMPADVPAVAAIEALVSPEPWSERLFADEFTVASARRHWLVAEETGPDVEQGLMIVGFGGMMFVADEGHLMNVATHPDHRRRGIAAALCAALFADAAERGMASLTLEVRISNVGARELYRRFGFVPVSSRRDYYRNADGTREDALILWLHDLGSALAPATSPNTSPGS